MNGTRMMYLDGNLLEVPVLEKLDGMSFMFTNFVFPDKIGRNYINVIECDGNIGTKNILDRDENGMTYLHHAVSQGNYVLTELFLKFEPDLMMCENNMGETPIVLLVKSNADSYNRERVALAMQKYI